MSARAAGVGAERRDAAGVGVGAHQDSAVRRRGHARAVVGRLAAVVLGLLLPLALFELSLRLFGPWPPGGYDTGAYIERHELLGHFHVPGHEGWLKSSEFTTFVKISPLGLRDRRTIYEKPPGTFRVLLLGDSYLEGVQVQQSETVAERLEALLNEPGGTPVDVINAGVAAYGTGQQVLLFEHEAYRYQPDLVILLFFVGNDVKNNSYMLELPGGKRELALKPYFDLDRDGEPRLLPGPPPARPNPLIGALRRCCWAYNLLEGNLFSKLGPAFRREDIEAVGGARNWLREVYDTEPDGNWRRAWQITEALLGRLARGSRDRGAPFVLVGVPDWRALDHEVWRQAIAGNRRLASGASPDAPTDRLGEIAARLGTPYVNLLPLFRQATAEGGGPYYLTQDGHWNAAGHAAAAWALAEMVRAQDLIRPQALRPTASARHAP